MISLSDGGSFGSYTWKNRPSSLHPLCWHMSLPIPPTDAVVPSPGQQPLDPTLLVPPPTGSQRPESSDNVSPSVMVPDGGRAPESTAADGTADESYQEPRFWEHDGVPAGLISLLVHTLLLLWLALISLSAGPETGLVIFSRVGESVSQNASQIVQIESVIDPNAGAESAGQDPLDEPVRSDSLAVSDIATAELTVPELDLNVDDRDRERESEWLREAESLRQQLAGTARSSAGAASGDGAGGGNAREMWLPAGGMAPRTASSRAELGARYGATPESEDAVEMALVWLEAHQQRSGGWSFDLSGEPCGGRCSHSSVASGNAIPSTAATGLSLLAFLGAGYNHHGGKYADTIRRGIYYLREQALPATYGLDLQGGSMYGHGIATLALTEVLAIDRYFGHEDSDLVALVEGAVLFTLIAQHDRGGWRYVPGSPGDMTISAWQILSLISARYGGIKLRTSTLSDAKDFIKSLESETGYEFGYVSRRPQRTTTAIGLCMLLYLGDSPFHTPFQHALSRLAARGPKKFDVYHDYYATMALHNARHPDWDRWHQPLRDHLVKTQAVNGHERGSWHFKDHHGDVGGRLYTTAMAALILEVYYRHLPLYQRRDG